MKEKNNTVLTTSLLLFAEFKVRLKNGAFTTTCTDVKCNLRSDNQKYIMAIDKKPIT